ncbi:hypothetical protein ACE6H2_013781 [Prunus campanulata]
MEEDCCATQLIYGDGKFNADGLQRFVKEVKLAECGVSYGVVAIVGPQSGGKSALQNHLFTTQFANSRRSQTTKDIWIAKCVGIEPCTIAMDLEGTDGRERGQDDTFKKQSTLFALAVSDIVLINIVVFLLSLITTFFDVKEEVVVLSSYEEKEKFKEEVTELRQRLSHSISPGGFSGDRRGLVPASGFSFSAQQIWKVIKENKDLDLPAHKVMVATVRCGEIANQIFNQLIYDKGWLALKEAVQTGPVQGFGKRLSSILGTYLSKYDIEAIYFDGGARNSKRQLLESKALDFVYPAYTTMLGHVRSKALEDFKVRLEQSLNKGRGFATYVRICTHSSMLEFDKGCADAVVIQASWDASRVREKLQRDIDAHASSVCSAKLSELNVNYEQQLSASLTGPVKTLLETGGKDTWASIRKLLNRETEVAISEFSTVVADFELDEATIAEMLQHLRDYSRNVVEKKAREEATKIMIHMKDRFSTVFNYDSDSMLRVWNGKEDIRSITKDARSASMKLLSVMAAIRLDEKPDHIEKVLFSSLMDGAVTVSSSQDREIGASVDPLASGNWEEVSSKNTLITPVQCQSLWRQFIAETENGVTQAISAHVMAATARCEEIANQKFSQLIFDEDWLVLEEAVQIGTVQGFGKRLSSILSTYLSKYDTEATIYFDEGARNSKRQLLESKALDFVYPAYTTMLGHVRSKALEDFKVRLEQSLNKGRGFATYVRICTHSSMLEFDKGCADAVVIQASWDASRVREKLQRDIDAHASSVCSAKLSELNVNYEQQLSASLTGPVKTLLETGGKDTWASIRKLLNRETEVAISEFSTVVADFELDEATIAEMLQHLRDYSRNVVEKKAREEATKIMIHMKDRFSTVFNYDSDSMLRVWNGKEDIRSITKDARSASMKLLSVMAAIRLDEKPDHIEKVLFSSLMDGAVTVSSSQDREIGASVDPLASGNWEEVSSKNTLITPVQCQSLWRQFIAETENGVTQAISAHVMAATARCEEIANQKFSQLIFDEDWLALEEAVQIGPVQGFGKRFSSILSTYLSKYDTEATIYFDEGARNSKRQLLESKALDFVYPAYTTMLGHVHSKALEDFKVRLEQSLNKGEGFTLSVRTCTQSSMLEFDKGCADAAIQQANWDASRVHEKLQRDIDAHASFICSAKLSELNFNYERQLSASLTGPVEALLEIGDKDTWGSIRKLLNRETEVAISKFSTAISDFELDKETIAKMLQHLRDYSRNVVEKVAREEATKIMIHMKDRFFRVFNCDSDSMPRVWTEKEDIRSITKDARSAALNLLSIMAAIRLDEKPDNIEKVLFSSLMDGTVIVSSSQDRRIGASAYPLASSTWEEEAYKQSNNWLPPPWATMAIVVHGFNQFMHLLKVGDFDSIVFMEEDCCATQLIYGDGEFNSSGLDRFVKEVKLAECGLSYAVVAIMGPQSSGKSTLLNHLFHTKFREMDAYSGRSQTTKGIWIAKCVGIEPCTIAMDLEGTDGRERGEDDTTFEKQSALFALAVSDIVLINMWCHDIGREQAANKPLLKTVFQTPFEYLEPVLREDIQKIWDGVPKPQAHKSTPFSDFFSVEVVALSSYEEKEEKFKEEVAQLRQRFFHSISPGGLAGDRRGVVPATGFSFSAQRIWKVIKENKDLDLPAHKVMVATVRCEEIANQKFNQLVYDEDWLALEEAVQTGPVQGFGKRLSSILGTYLSEYDMEAVYFDEGVRNSKRQLLGSKALDFVYPAYTTMLGHLRSKALEDFKVRLEQSLNKGGEFASSVRTSTQSSMLEFDKGCADAAIQQADWDASRVREKLKRDIDAHASSVRSAKLSELNINYEKQLSSSLTGPVEALLETGGKDTWTSIRKLLNHETEVAVSKFSAAVAGFELDKDTSTKMMQNLRDYARNVVEKKAREEAANIMIHMKDRFSTVFNYDSDSMPRVWTGNEDIRSITKDACSASLKLLSVMAAIRLEEKPDNIEKLLFSSLMDGTVTVSSSQDRRIAASTDPLASSTWEEEAHKRSNNWLPPPWAIMAMIVLGFNEFMLLLKNPLYLMVLFVAFLISKALWVQMDIAGQFQHGTLSGILSISSRFLPTVMDLLRKLAEEAQGNPAPEAPRRPVSVASQSHRNETPLPNTTSSSIPESSVSSNISSSDGDVEYSSPPLRQRRPTNVQEVEPL